ncbi:rnase iii [Diplodia corticola]|uniref:Rnase iii n=1 Tax=Diplodia corticola TaxID=236234 RepID=A0A1J9QUE6_9PEZI|nr:rnase iii [Diplodia corticola]OJD32590.1 rnase iii [Diplodia corticola]
MQQVERVLGYEFSNSKLRDEALLAAGTSVSDPKVRGDLRGNKRLAMVGDAVLQLVVLEKWYGEGTDPSVGNKLLKETVSNAALRVRASKAHLQHMIRLNPCQKGEAPQETLASTVEALVGAVWFDSSGDIDMVREVMAKLGVFRHE